VPSFRSTMLVYINDKYIFYASIIMKIVPSHIPMTLMVYLYLLIFMTVTYANFFEQVSKEALYLFFFHFH